MYRLTKDDFAIISVVAIIIGSVFIGLGTSWQVGLGVGLVSWGGLPIKGK